MISDIIFPHQFNYDTKTGKGFIYILSNPVYPGLVKIGQTARTPAIRASELSRSTAVPRPFIVEWSQFVESDLFELEKQIHHKMKEYRNNEKREFFELPVGRAIEMVTNIIDTFWGLKFDGITYRKKQDARWGFFYRQIDAPFEYITTPIIIKGCLEFMPDFYLPDQNAYVLIHDSFLDHKLCRLAAYGFAQATGKFIFQFWDCEPGIEFDDDGSIIFHTGTFITPDGDYDGRVEWGICPNCGSKHIGLDGTPELIDLERQNTSKTNCSCYVEAERQILVTAYEKVTRILS